LKEKELRIALVCFGGVSLAVYMHGVSKEILKLVRASSALHDIDDHNARANAAFFDRHGSTDPEFDTEAHYFELLRDIGRTLELRVIVDIISGASAGGINATMLARAIAHDLPMGSLRDLWLDNADVAKLLAPEARATLWSKWFMRPLLWAAGLSRLPQIRDADVRAKLSMFVRSRWFKPPLSGLRMAGLMYDAVTSMGQPRSARDSLLPSGLALDLFVTVTDFYGHHQLMQIHNPPLIHEREHRHLLRFRYLRQPSGAVNSDFDLANAASLAFAARATSSFPGGFPPARILEMDELLAMRGEEWPRRAEFIASNFEHYGRVNVDSASASFIDGSVLNNRPFRAAIDAIRGRPAYREVDRRIVYIDPDPAPPGAAAHHSIPGFFATLRGAISDIPLTQPITDELNWIIEFNERARRLRSIVDSARPYISGHVSSIMTPGTTVTADLVRAWREQANEEAIRNAGFAHEAYVQLKLASVRSFISHLIIDLRGIRARSPFARAVSEIIDAWAEQAGAAYLPSDAQHLRKEPPGRSGLPRWAAMLLAFDIDYRERRLHFLIEGQNRLYAMLRAGQFAGTNPAVLDELKREFYKALETLRQRKTVCLRNRATEELVNSVFRAAPSPSEMKGITAYARSFAARHANEIAMLIDKLAADIDLQSSTRDIDIILAQTGPDGWSPEIQREVLINYLGFPFWDVLTFPVMSWREPGEFNEILIDRISPVDATAVEKLGSPRPKGTAFEHFAAFLSRAYRENDYLLGRLQGLDRLIDIVCDAAGIDARTDPAMLALKKRGFLAILAAEEAHLPQSQAMIAELRRRIGEGAIG
jgi:patatin-related protein